MDRHWLARRWEGGKGEGWWEARGQSVGDIEAVGMVRRLRAGEWCRGRIVGDGRVQSGHGEGEKSTRVASAVCARCMEMMGGHGGERRELRCQQFGLWQAKERWHRRCCGRAQQREVP